MKIVHAALLIVASCLACAQIYAQPLHGDNAWFLYAAGRMLDGSRLYVDLKALNPPLIFCLNAIPVAAAQLTPVGAIVAFKTFVLILCGLSILASRALLRGLLAGDRTLARLLLLCLAAILLVLPGANFGQREHMLLVLIVPACLLIARRRSGLATRKRLRIPVNIAGMIGLLIKPTFLLAWLIPELYLHFASRSSIRKTLAANVEALAVMVGYLLIVVLFFPQYLQTMKLVLTTYSRWNAPLAWILRTPEVLGWCWILAVYLMLPRPAAMRESLTCCMLVSFGLMLGSLGQHKGWDYHFLPPLGIGLFALAWAGLARLLALERIRVSAHRTIVALVSLAVIVWGVFTIGYVGRLWRADDAGRPIWANPLSKLIRSHGPSTPVMVFSTSVLTFWPMVTYTGARWLSPYHHLWSLPAFYPPESCRGRRQHYRHYEQMSAPERALLDELVGTLQRQRPALLLVDTRNLIMCPEFDMMYYLKLHPEGGRALSGYRRVAQIGFIDVLQGPDPAGPGVDRIGRQREAP